MRYNPHAISSCGRPWNSYDTVDYEASNTELSHQSYQSLNFVFRIIAVVLLLIDIFVRTSDFQKKKKKKQDRNLRSGK